MKRIVFGILLGNMINVTAMEPQGGHKDKERIGKVVSSQSGSSSSSGSHGEVSVFDAIELHRNGSPALDTARLQQQGKIIIKDEDLQNLAELERKLKLAGSRVESSEKRKSVIYMPELNLAAMGRDLSGGSVYRGQAGDLEKGNSHDDLEQQAMEETFAFFLQYMKDKSQNPNLDLKVIKSDLLKKFKKAHNTPPTTPNDTANTKIQKLQKRKQGVVALRKGSTYQATARAKRELLPQSPALSRARDAKPMEILTALMAEPEVQEGLQSIEQLVVNLLAEKNKQTQSSLQNTRYGGILATLISAGASALITYLGTKKSC